MIRLLLLLLFAASLAQGAVWQYAVPVPQGAGKPDGMAYLWVPPGADRLRGAVVAGKTTIELNVVKDPLIRQACAEEKLALVFFMPSLNFPGDSAVGGERLQKVLDDLATASGYRELRVAPLMSLGHSAGSAFACNVAYWAPSRCFGVLHIKGGGIAPPPFAGEARITGVPYLQVVGQFDEFGGAMRNADGREVWMGSRDGHLRMRAQDDRYLFTCIVDPGAGHFSWNPEIAAYTAKYIRKAAQARIPGDWPADAKEPVRCREIDVTSGWLTDGAIVPAGACAAYADYPGDRAKALWHFDEEMARAAMAIHAGGLARRDQFLKWNDRYWLDAGVRHYLNDFTWVGDGQTFELHPAWADAYPKIDSPQAPRWADAGKPCGHSDAPILMRRMNGAVEQVGPTRFRLTYDPIESSRFVIMAYSPATADYRYTEVQCMVRNLAPFSKGTAQTITFPPVGPLKAGAAIDLPAVSDSGLPVEYFVEYGPAMVEGARLRVAELPQRATFPVPVKIIAYQLGRALAPFVQAAKPVEQVVMVEAP